DWESRLPCVLDPRKSHLPLFTRKQQRLLNKAREMDGVPDLSALLKGKLQLLSKKSTTVDPQGPSNSGGDGASEGVDGGVGVETSASGPKKKKKSKKTKGRATDEVPPEESASLDATSEGSKEKKKKDGKKDEGLAEGREGALVEAAPDGRPKKRTKSSVEAEPRPSTSDTNAADTTLVDVVGEDNDTPENLSEERRKTSSREGGSGDEPVANERSAPDSSARKSSRPEGSLAKKRRIEFPDRVEFSYDETTPLILNPLRCAELTRQFVVGRRRCRNWKISTSGMNTLTLLLREGGDMSVNFLVEKYDSALKQTMIQLGSSEKLAQARLKAIERVRAEHKKANEKAAKEMEILRVKFEELEEGGGLEERPENENLEEVPEKDNLEIGDIPVREEETENVGIEDPVLVSDSSSEGREDEEEEDDRAEETLPPQPVEEETTNKVGDRDVPKPSPPTVDSLVHVPTRVEDPAAAATEDPVGPLTLGTPRRTIKIMCLDALLMLFFFVLFVFVVLIDPAVVRHTFILSVCHCFKQTLNLCVVVVLICTCNFSK
ncbi:hypothetical protein HID58_048578, partial [Brassica napus]